MKRLIFVVFLFSCCTFAMGQNNCAMGLVYDRNAHYSTPMVNVDSLIQSVSSDNSQQVFASQYYLDAPPALSQGGQPSCTGWAVGYAAASILVYQKYGDWTLSTMSPSFVYNQAKLSSDCSRGASFSNAFNLVRDKGICTIESMSYDASSCSALPNASILRQAAYNTMSYGRVNEKSVTNICSLLSKGYPIVVGVYVTSSFYSMWYSDGIWRNDERSNNDGYHACCVVGYDNVNRMFKVQNSWGSRGGDNGFFWVTYDLVNNGVFNEAYVLYDLNPAVDISIQGPSQFCDTAVYTLENVPTGATIKWKNYNTLQSTYPYSIKRGQGTSRVVYKRGRKGYDLSQHPNFVSLDYTGSAVVSATVSFGGQSYTASKDVYIGHVAPKIALYDSLGLHMVPSNAGTSYRMVVVNCADVPDNDIHWVVSSSTQEFERLGRGRYFPLIISEPQTVTAEVSCTTENCGLSTTTQTYYFRLPSGMSGASLAYQNPVSAGGMLDVSITRTDNGVAALQSSETACYTLELWSELYGRVRTVDADEPTTQIALQGLPAGTYFMKLIIDGEPVTTEQLIIK